MLARFVPWREREPRFRVEPRAPGPPLTRCGLAGRAAAGGLAGLIGAWLTLALLDGARALRAGRGFEPWGEGLRLLQPATTAQWLTLLGVLVCGALAALGTAALVAARHGSGLAAEPGQE